MNLYNIKDNSEQVSFQQAVKQGLGRGQGLFFPDTMNNLTKLYVYYPVPKRTNPMNITTTATSFGMSAALQGRK